MVSKPDPMPHVYDWQKIRAWLTAEAPTVARELAAVVREHEGSNGSMLHVSIDDWERGWCGDALSVESIAWLKANLAPAFWLHVWW